MCTTVHNLKPVAGNQFFETRGKGWLLSQPGPSGTCTISILKANPLPSSRLSRTSGMKLAIQAFVLGSGIKPKASVMLGERRVWAQGDSDAVPQCEKHCLKTILFILQTAHFSCQEVVPGWASDLTLVADTSESDCPTILLGKEFLLLEGMVGDDAKTASPQSSWLPVWLRTELLSFSIMGRARLY